MKKNGLINRVLANPHVNTILANSGLRKVKLLGSEWNRAGHEFCEFQTSFGKLTGLYTPGTSSSMVVVIHGWLGHANSSFTQLLAADLQTKGYSILRLNLRDHGGSEGLNEEPFHSCRLEETVEAMQLAVERFKAEKVILAGFSLGGNFCIRIAALGKINLHAVFCISPAIDPKSCSDALVQQKVYHNYFLKKWRRVLKSKSKLFPGKFERLEWKKEKNLERLTEKLLLKYTDFDSLEEYYLNYQITKEILNRITIPTWILTAVDDPITRYQDLSGMNLNSNIHVEATETGGHCGFLTNLRLDSRVNSFVSEGLQKTAKLMSS